MDYYVICSIFDGRHLGRGCWLAPGGKREQTEQTLHRKEYARDHLQKT